MNKVGTYKSLVSVDQYFRIKCFSETHTRRDEINTPRANRHGRQCLNECIECAIYDAMRTRGQRHYTHTLNVTTSKRRRSVMVCAVLGMRARTIWFDSYARVVLPIQMWKTHVLCNENAILCKTAAVRRNDEFQFYTLLQITRVRFVSIGGVCVASLYILCVYVGYNIVKRSNTFVKWRRRRQRR